MRCEMEPTKLNSDGEGEKQPNSGNKEEMWKNYIGLIVEDAMGKEFQCFQDAYKFYCDYAMCCTVVMRKDDMGKNKNGEIRWHQYVCNRKGERNKKHLIRSDKKREHRPLTRTKCIAKFHVTQHHLTFFV